MRPLVSAHWEKAIDIDPKSLMRMLGPSGNPKTDNFVEIIKYLQTRDGVHLKVETAMAYPVPTVSGAGHSVFPLVATV